MPALTAVLEGGTALYLTPTKALAADQLRAIRSLRMHGVRAAVLDGDTPAAGRNWARANASYLVTTPDTLHLALLPGHVRWARFLSRLRYVIVDECHGYRGVFGSHVAQVLRRLRRIAAYYAEGRAVRERARRGRRDGPLAAGPVFILASATVSEPGRCAALLTGLDAEEVDADAAPRGAVTFALWEPPLTALRGAAGARMRRTATAEASRLLGDLVTEDMTTVAFVRSRRAAEAVAMGARRVLAETGAPDLASRVAAYRSGYLPEDRRQLEDQLRTGRLAGVAATTALELGVNICGLDAVLIAGWPGTRASLWQQAGRAGRAGRDALAVLIARADPLDTYLVHHPEAVFGRPVETTVLDPDNPYVLAPHLCAAAAELPLTAADLDLFGARSAQVTDELTGQGLLRQRGAGWYLSARGRALTRVGLRGIRRSSGADRGGHDGQADRDGGRAVGPRAGAHRCRLPAPGADLPGARARPGRRGRAGGRGRSRLLNLSATADRHPGDGRTAAVWLGRGEHPLRRRPGDPAGDLVPAAAPRYRARGRRTAA